MSGGRRPPVRPSRVEVDLDAVAHNVELLARRAGPSEVCAVVKADGYGHGAAPVARAALEAGAGSLAVALVEEGEALREAGIGAPVLVLSEPPVAGAARLVEADLTPTVYSEAFAAALAAIGRRRGAPVAVHAEVDTGMGRVGVPAGRWPALAGELAGLDGLEVDGVWTHLARADEPDGDDTTAAQLASFADAVEAGRDAGLDPGVVHVGNSAAVLRRQPGEWDLVRVGIALYGLSPGPALPAADHGLRPAARLVSEVAYVKRIRAGSGVSYGHRWSAPTDGVLATVPIGYADGVPRLLSNEADVLIGGVRRPVVGSVCMDQIMVWCGHEDQDQAVPGAEVVLLGRQGDEEITADEWAGIVGTITYEIATGLSARLPRIHHGRG